MHRRSALHATTLVALAVLLALAGCSAFGGSGTPTPTATPEPTATPLPTVECVDEMAPGDTPLEAMLPRPGSGWERTSVADTEIAGWNATVIEGRYDGPDGGEYTVELGRFSSRQEAGETLAKGLYTRYAGGARVGVTGPFGVEADGAGFPERTRELLLSTPCLSEDDEIKPAGAGD